MKKMLVMLFLIAAIPAASFLLPYAAAEEPRLTGAAADGQRKSMPCMSCHTGTGNSRQGEHPKLAGQNMKYLAIAMRAYRDGRRDSEIMRSFMANLSDRDIEDIASFYSSQQPQ